LWGANEVTWDALSKNYQIGDFYIAYTNGIPSGCMALIDHDSFFWPDVKKGESLFVHKLAVKKAARKSGVADALMETFKEQGAIRGAKTLRLDTHALRPKLRAFYERHGFVFVEVKVFKGDRHTAFYTYTLPDKKTGWERENRTHFDDIVVNYDKVRWDYPAELYADIFDYLGAGHKTALEIGAGTGKATAPILNAGYDVTAVEMGVNMSEFILEKFKGQTNFKVITATFEDAMLQGDSYDLVYAASAFHWVDAQIGCPKVYRLLKSGGVFALFRNNAVQSDGNETYNEIQAVYDKYYYSHYKSDKRPIKISETTYEDFLKPAEIYRGFRFESLEQYGFKDIAMKLYNASRTYGADEYIALLDTMSDHRAMPEENRKALYAKIKESYSNTAGS